MYDVYWPDSWSTIAGWEWPLLRHSRRPPILQERQVVTHFQTFLGEYLSNLVGWPVLAPCRTFRNFTCRSGTYWKLPFRGLQWIDWRRPNYDIHWQMTGCSLRLSLMAVGDPSSSFSICWFTLAECRPDLASQTTNKLVRLAITNKRFTGEIAMKGLLGFIDGTSFEATDSICIVPWITSKHFHETTLSNLP
jgi:hypothetical protein